MATSQNQVLLCTGTSTSTSTRSILHDSHCLFLLGLSKSVHVLRLNSATFLCCDGWVGGGEIKLWTNIHKNYLIEHVCCILRSNYEQTYKNLSSWTCVLYIDSSIGPQPRTGRSVWNPLGVRTVRMVEDANATFYNLGRELVGMGIRMSCITCLDFLYLLCLVSFLLNTRFR